MVCYMKENNILFDLEQAAHLHPEKKAIADRYTSISFSCLRKSSRALGYRLELLGAAGKPVGVIALRESVTPLLFMAAVYAGAFYVPIDPRMHEEKKQAVLDDAEISIILGTQPEEEALKGLSFKGTYIRYSLTEAPDSLPEVRLKVDEDMCQDRPLYMVYTSGSTGKPKGVLKSHAAMRSYIDSFVSVFPVSDDEILGNQTPFCFDASAKDIYLMLKKAVTMEILATELFALPMTLIAYMNERRISYICWVPSALSVVTQLNTFSELRPQYLKKVFFVGEVFPMKQLNRWRAALPDLSFTNLYGQSELAGICCYFPVDRSFEDNDILPIGFPMPNCRIYLMDNGAEVKEAGHIGEIFIESPALASCYWHDAEKTSAGFVNIKTGDGVFHKVFRSGDMAEYNSRGELVFASRRDHQIKHMGHRIELGEIEASANAIGYITASCCLYDDAKHKIVLFAETDFGEISANDIKGYLRRQLSDYMVPNKVVLCKIPRNANGKTDRMQLKQLL